MCRKMKPDLILVDWDMPNMNGIDFIQNYTMQTIGQMPTIIYCITEYIETNVNQALQSGANTFIMKPLDMPSLRQKLEETNVLRR